MPVSDCEVRDPRIRRTRRLLQEALRTLMQTKSFDEISVQDITDAATVNRATFYDHYTDKYALLEAMIAGNFHMLLLERNVCYDGTCPSAATGLILATCDYLRTISAGVDCNAANPQHSFFQPLMEAAITNAIRRVLTKGIPRPAETSAESSEDSPRPSPEMIATATAWAIYGAVKEWFNTPGRPPAEQIVPEILKLVLPMLSSAGEPQEVAPL